MPATLGTDNTSGILGINFSLVLGESEGVNRIYPNIPVHSLLVHLALDHTKKGKQHRYDPSPQKPLKRYTINVLEIKIEEGKETGMSSLGKMMLSKAYHKFWWGTSHRTAIHYEDVSDVLNTLKKINGSADLSHNGTLPVMMLFEEITNKIQTELKDYYIDMDETGKLTVTQSLL